MAEYGTVPRYAVFTFSCSCIRGFNSSAENESGNYNSVHTHPCDEYVYVLSGIIETGKTTCTQGMFWFTPSQTQQGAHRAISDVELITIRLGEMGTFESINI